MIIIKILALLSTIFHTVYPLPIVIDKYTNDPSYICTNYGSKETVQYYDINNKINIKLPTMWNKINNVGHCAVECAPCESYNINNVNTFIGYGAMCNLDYTLQNQLGLYNITSPPTYRINYYKGIDTIVNDPLESPGIYEAKGNNFIQKYILCVYKKNEGSANKLLKVITQHRNINRHRYRYASDIPKHPHIIINLSPKIIISHSNKDDYDDIVSSNELNDELNDDITSSVHSTYTPTVSPNVDTPAVPTVVPPTVSPNVDIPTIPTVIATRVPPTVSPNVDTPTIPTRVPPNVDTPTVPTRVPPNVDTPTIPTVIATRVPPTVSPNVDTPTVPSRVPSRVPTRVPPNVDTTTVPTRVPPNVDTPTVPTRVPPNLDTPTVPSRVPPTVSPNVVTTADINSIVPTNRIKVNTFESNLHGSNIPVTASELAAILANPSTTLVPTQSAPLLSTTTVGTQILPTSLPTSIPSIQSTSMTTSNTEPLQQPLLSDKTIFIIILTVLVILVGMIVYMIYYSCCRKQVNNDKYNNFSENIRNYLYMNKTATVLNFSDMRPSLKVTIPKEVNDTNKITRNDMDPFLAISWTYLSYIYDGIINRRRSSGSIISRKTLTKQLSTQQSIKIEETNKFWNVEINSNNLYEYTPGHPITILKSYFLEDNKSTELFLSSCLLTSIVYENKDEDDIILFSFVEKSVLFGEKYILIIKPELFQNIIMKTNIPELYVYENISAKSASEFPTHFIHNKLVQYKSDQENYRKLSFEEVQNATWLKKAFVIKQLNTNNTIATEYIDNYNNIIKGLSNINNLLEPTMEPIKEEPILIPEISNVVKEHIRKPLPSYTLNKKKLTKSATTPILPRLIQSAIVEISESDSDNETLLPH